jgi:CheY-like chemotaxis protein
MPQTIVRDYPCVLGACCIRGARNGMPRLCETVTGLIFLLDEQGKILSCDPRVALLGYSAPHLIGRRLLGMLDTSAAAHVARRLNAQKAEYLDTLACTIESGEGRSLEGCLRLMPFHDPTHRACMVAALGDACLSFAAQAQQAGISSCSVGQAWDCAQRLLTFELEDPMQMNAVDLNEMVANTDTIKSIQRLIGNDVLLEMQFCDQPAWMWGNPGQIDQLLRNLSRNAREVLSRESVLSIETALIAAADARRLVRCDLPPGGYVLLSISATGTSDMTSDAKEHRLKPLMAKNGGTDVSLAIAHDVVLQHRGYLWGATEAEQGTSVQVLFPALVDVLSDRDGQVGSIVGPHGTEGILLVEDEDSVRCVLARGLSCMGYRVYSVANARQAISLACAAPGIIDLAIVDVVMPEMCGPELVTTLRDVIGDLKVLYISGYPDTYLGDAVSEEAGAKLLRKPLNLSEMAHQVRAELDAPTRALFAHRERACMPFGDQ